MGHFALAILLIATAVPGESLRRTAAVAFAALEAAPQFSASASPQAAAQATPQEADDRRRRGGFVFGGVNYGRDHLNFGGEMAPDPSDMVANNLKTNRTVI